MSKQEKVALILQRLYAIWPEPKSELDFASPLQLLVATILSAQTTDRTVNSVTPALFARYPDAASLAGAEFEELDGLISKVNFHRTKAKNITAMAQKLVADHGGQVPDTMAELIKLPGVARKTANVVLGGAFGKQEGIAVDTHVIRLSNCLGLSDSIDPVKIEQDLMAIVPQDKWTHFSHLLILYGRYHSPARKDCREVAILGDLVV
jgi:endonuclease-3